MIQHPELDRHHPIDKLRWVDIMLVRPNQYNPNAQLPSSTLMLIQSIQRFGFTMPIVVRPAHHDGTHIIIDGEHRWRAARALEYKYVPVVVLDTDRAGQISATVLHNRARGLHAIESTLQLIRTLRDEGLGDEEVESALGLTPEERERLECSEDAFLRIAGGKDRSMETG